MARTQRRSRKAQEAPEEEKLETAEPEDGAAVPVPEPEPAPPPPEAEEEPEAPRRPRRSGGAQLHVVARGTAEDVRDAMSKMAPPAAAPAPEEEEEPEVDDQKIVDLMNDPKNAVTVSRLYPRRWKREKCDTELETYRCPASIDDVTDDVFTRFGGKRFLVSIHPNTPTGKHKPLYGFAIENPEEDEPRFGEEPQETVVGATDPTLVPDNDPLAQLDKTLTDQIRMADKVLKLKGAKSIMKNLNEDEGNGDKKGRAEGAEREERVRALEDRLGVSQLEGRIDRRLDRLENAIVTMAEGKKGGSSDDGLIRLIIAQMNSSDAKFQTMMQTMMTTLTSQGKRHDDMDSMLDRLSKLKSVFGSDDSRVKKIEETLLEMALDRIEGGGGESDESDVKYAVKQIVPLARTYIEKKLDEPSEGARRVPSEEEFKRLVKEEAMKLARGMAEDWQKKGYLVKIPEKQGQQRVGLPAAAAREKAGAPSPGAKSPSETHKKNPEVEIIERHETPPAKEGAQGAEEEELPAGPLSPAYDRKLAVNFVLDTILEEVDAGCPADGYTVGDIMDRLDDELLDGLRGVTTAEELERLIGPHADAAKVAEIKAKGKNPDVKSWLTRVIVTAQDEFRSAVQKYGEEWRQKMNQ